MKFLYILLVIFFIGSIEGQDVAADFDRSKVTLMVLPKASGKEDIINKIENDQGYRAAISEINSMLLKRGYKNTKDFKVHQETVKKRSEFTASTSRTDEMKTYIEAAPVDVLIETNIVWDDPEGNPQNRQAHLMLKAVDKYTGNIYADAASIHSKKRHFPSLQRAIENTLNLDGKEAFDNFLNQLDASYEIVFNEGRPVNIKFEVGTESQEQLSQRLPNGQRLSGAIENFIAENSFKGQYRIIGESPSYIDFTTQVPLIDENGNPVTPSRYIGRKVDDYFYGLGFEADYYVLGTWLNFVLKKKLD